MKTKLVFVLALLMIACIVLPAPSLEHTKHVNDAQYSPIDIAKAGEKDAVLRLNRMGTEPPWI